MKTFHVKLISRELSIGGRMAIGAWMDHFGASGKKSPDGTSLTVPSGRKVIRVVPREYFSPLIGRDFFIL